MGLGGTKSASDRQYSAGGSSAASHPLITKRIIIKSVGAVIIIGLAGAAGAHQASDGSTIGRTADTKHSQVELNVQTPGADSSTSASASNDSSSQAPEAQASPGHVKVTVNGQNIPVPTNGSSRQTVTSPNGSTTVNISSNQSATGNSHNSSFTSTSYNLSTSSDNTSVNMESHN